MPSVGTVRINSVVDNSALTRGFTQARSSMSGFVSSVTSGGSKIVTSFAKIGLAVEGVSVLVRGIKNAVAGPLALAAELEQTTVSFETLLSSTEQAQKTLGELRTFAASTPFQFPEITDSAKKLIAFGFSADEVTGELKKLGDISAGLSIPLNELSDLYGKLAVSGRVMGEDINQLLGRGIPIVGELAKQFGVAESDIKGMVSAGKVGFEDVQQAITNLTTGQGKFAGLMEKQSGTLAGTWSTLKDNISVVLTEIGAGIADAFNLTQANISITSFVQSTIPTIKSWIESFKSFIDQTKPIFTQYFNTLFAYWSALSDIATQVFNAIVSAVGQFLPSWNTFKSSVMTALVTMEFGWTNWRKVAELVLKTVAFKVVEFANNIKHTFTVVIPTYLKYLWENWRDILGEIGRAGQLIFGHFINNVVDLFSNLPGLISGSVSFGDIWKPMTDEMKVQLKNLPDIPKREMGQLESQLKSDVDSLKSELSKGLEELKAERLASPELAKIETKIDKPSLDKASEQVKSKMKEATDAIKLADVAEFGSQEARSAILRNKLSIPQDNEQKQQTALAKSSLDVQKRQLKQMKSGKKEDAVVLVI